MTPEDRILFLYGNDEYAIAHRLRGLAAAFETPSEAGMNMARLDARTMTDEQWSNAVNSMPFMAGQRLVILDNPSARFARRGGPRSGPPELSGSTAEADAQEPQESAAGARDKFLHSLENMPPTTRLVITEVVDLGSKRDRIAADKHWLAAWLRKHNQSVILMEQPAGSSMTGWIVKEAKSQGGEFSGPAAQRLAEMVGSDTRQAAQEITKLLTYVNWSRPVTPADVESLSPLTAPPDVFKMVDALSAGQAGEAQRLLRGLLEFQDIFSLWGMIVRQFRYLLVAREVLDARGGETQALQALAAVEGRGVLPFVAGKSLAQARGFTSSKLELIYHRLLEIDEEAKTGRMPLEVAVDLLIVEVAR